MPENANEIISKVIVVLAIACVVFLMAKIIAGVLRNRYAPVRTVKARVVDKFKEDRFSKIYRSAARTEQYLVVFSIEGKKRAFRVSKFSYGGYKRDETGTLKYRGDKIIDFS